MDWLKKKKDEAKQAAAKLSNKRTAFRGEGNVLGGSDATPAASAPPAAAPRGHSIKLPFTSSKPDPLTEEQQRKRRELQAQALEQRGNAWEKRVATARKNRLQQGGEQESKLQYVEPAETKAPSGPPPVVLSNEEVKARELQNAHQQMGFNPYAATFSSSTQAVSAMNSIGGAPAGGNAGPPPAPFPATPQVTAPEEVVASSREENGAVYVLLRQDPTRAIAAAQTLLKMLSTVVKSPEVRAELVALRPSRGLTCFGFWSVGGEVPQDSALERSHPVQAGGGAWSCRHPGGGWVLDGPAGWGCLFNADG
jgi:hypothetical protein